jgi:hypothetical protein
LSGWPRFAARCKTGDYSVAGLQDLFSIERKTVSDLVGYCMGENREGFERELHRLRGYRFKRLLVVGSEAEIRYDLQVVFVPTARAGGGSPQKLIKT